MSARRRIGVLVLAAALLMAGALALGCDDDSDPALPQPPQTTAAFVDSIAVAMHLSFTDTPYARQREIFDALEELGVRHIREGVPVGSDALEPGLRRAVRLGIRATLVIDLEIAPEEGVAAAVRVMGGRIDAFEAPNELDHFGPPDWKDRLKSFMPAIRTAVLGHSPDVPVVGPSFVASGHYGDVDKATFDVGNFHPYPGGLPPENTLEQAVRSAREVVPGKRIVFTETGYHNALAATVDQPPASEEAAAVYLPRALLTAFALGVERTFIYELVDLNPDPGLVDPVRHWGLLRSDLSRKPAFHAVRNLIGAVERSPGRAQVPPAVPSVSSRERVRRVALTRADGSRAVALWRPAFVWNRDAREAIEPVPATVRLSWARPALDLSVVRPSRGPAPELTRSSATELELPLDGDVVLLSYR